MFTFIKIFYSIWSNVSGGKRQQFFKTKLLYFHDDIITSRWHHGDVIWLKVLLKLFYYSRPNLLVKFNEKWVTWTNFTKKKIDKVVLSYFGLVFAFALSHHWQNCNYSKTNKAIFKFAWNFQKTCETFFFLFKCFLRGELILPTPWRLGFKSEAKPEKSKKSKS